MEVTVRSGDTFSYYSNLFMIPMQLILDSNPECKPTDLNLAEIINIPGFVRKPYIIQEGDTLSKLAASRNLQSDAILLLNQEQKANELKAGDTILIPERVTVPLINPSLPCDSKNLNKLISCMKNIYPFITVSTIGKSVLETSIQEIRIGKGEKKVHMNASFHANEWITTLVLMTLVNKYLYSLTNGNHLRGNNPISLYKTVELSIVPMVNPDGVDLVLNGPPPKRQEDVIKINGGCKDFIHWKANIRGVDLNKQYPASWEKLKNSPKHPKLPAPRDYPGDSPLTEPEAIAMADLVKNNSFNYIVAFHTQGREFYWGYEGFEPAEAEELAKEFERVSGYQAIRYVDSHAGYKDWYIQEFKRPGFTLELGWGINPLPLSQLNEILTQVEGIFLAALSYYMDI